MTMMNLRNLLASASLFAGVAAQGSFPLNQTVGIDVQPSVLRVFSDGGAGTANLIGARQFGNKLKLAFVTADHVMTGSRSASLGFGGRDQRGQFEFNTILFESTQIGRGDLNVFGVTIELPVLSANAAENTRREGILTGLRALAPVANPNNRAFTFTEWGYGLGAAAGRIGDRAFDFVYDPTVAAHEYGIKRTFTKDATGVTAGATVGRYTYDRIDWTVGTASGAPGDSGAGLWRDDAFIGILTGGRDVRGEGKIGWNADFAGRGLAFSEADVTAMNRWAAAYVPTPGTAALLAAAGVICVRRRR